jgi:hypothetical protein
MSARNDNNTRWSLITFWNTPPRSGLRRAIAPWEYRHPRGFAAVRMIAAVFLLILAALVTAAGPAAYGWAIVVLAGAAANFSYAAWLLRIANAAPASA